MWNLNRNEPQRDEIIFGKYEPEKYLGGIRRFEDLTIGTLKKLEELGFVDILDRQNSCPTIRTIMKFMEEYPGYEASGYVVSRNRDDYRISIDGLRKVGDIPVVELEEFMRVFGEADDLNVTSTFVSCWFD